MCGSGDVQRFFWSTLVSLGRLVLKPEDQTVFSFLAPDSQILQSFGLTSTFTKAIEAKPLALQGSLLVNLKFQLATFFRSNLDQPELTAKPPEAFEKLKNVSFEASGTRAGKVLVSGTSAPSSCTVDQILKPLCM